MRAVKQVLRPERLRLVPEQFSWVDQALVQHGLIDRMSARAAALYLFLVTVTLQTGPVRKVLQQIRRDALADGL